jgi:hypothetical protein
VIRACDNCGRHCRPDSEEPREWVHVTGPSYQCGGSRGENEAPRYATVDGSTLVGAPCPHSGGFRTDDGRWECSGCGHIFASYEAWGEETGHQAAVASVKAAIARDLAEMDLS